MTLASTTRSVWWRGGATCLLLALLVLTGCDAVSPGPSQDEASTPLAASGSAAATADAERQDESFIVVFKEDAENVRGLARRLAHARGGTLTHTYAASIKGFAFRGSQQAAEALTRNPNVAYVEPDRPVTLAPPCGTPKGGPCEPDDGDGGGGGSETVPEGITRVGGGATYTGSNVAWIIDTGIDLDHPDLNVEAARGFNAFTKGRDGKSLDDGNGHGSHVAGTIAAIDNEIGVVGVAAGATVIPVKVLDSRGSGSYSGVIAGIDYVAEHGSAGDVANMSLGGGASQAVDDAVRAAASSGIQFALAAGNDSDNAGSYSPARVNGTGIYTISAVDDQDVFASFSNYGNPPVDYAAPGVGISSTYKDGGYATLSGTSMATPHVAGVLLLGSVQTSGYATGDPDGDADPIASTGS